LFGFMSQVVERDGGGDGACAVAPDTAVARAEDEDGPGAIDVRAFFSLADFLPPAGRSSLTPSRADLTVAGVATAVGVPVKEVGFVLKNGRRAGLDDPVVPGDRVALFPDYVPYHKVYGTCIV
jgi:Mut7-C ubiquitin